jgi:hypothetical protein
MASALRLRQRLSGLKNSIRVGFFIFTDVLPVRSERYCRGRNLEKRSGGAVSTRQKLQNSRLIQMCPDKYTLQNTKKTKGRDSLLAHYALKTVKLFCLLRSQLKRHLSLYPCNTLFAKLTADEAGSRKSSDH